MSLLSTIEDYCANGKLQAAFGMIRRVILKKLQAGSAAILASLMIMAASVTLAEDADQSEASAHLLAAEIALQRADYLTAASEYRQAAESSGSIDIARQATRVAFSYEFNDDALRSARRWLELDQDDDEALLYVAQIELRVGKLREAGRHFRTLIERGEEQPDQRLLSLVQILSQEDPENADAVMRSLSKRYKDSPLAHYAAAVMALQAEDVEHAASRSLRAIELDPGWLKAKLLYARTLLLSGQADEAIDYTARLIGDDPDPDPDARIELAMMYMSVERNDDALSQVNQILLEQPSRSDAMRLMAIINFREENLDAAWDDFEDLLASGRHTMDALYYLGRIADFRSEHERAIRLYSQVRSGPNAVASQRRASALIAFEQNEPEEALKQLDEFAKDNPRHAVDMVLTKAQLLSALDRHDAALELYDKAVEFRPDSESTVLGRAELLLRMDRLDDAIAVYRQAVRRWPDSSIALNALGYTLADRTDEYSEAEKLIRKALKYDPDSPAITDSLGWVLHKRGRHEAALAELEKAYAAFPDHEVAAHLVEVLTVLDREDEARELLQSAEEQTPDSKLLKDVRERMFGE